MKAPRTFAQLIAQEERNGGANLISPSRAVGVLVDGSHRFSTKQWRAAVAEIEAATIGQYFRLDTAAGPLLEEIALWRFAGCSGPMHSCCMKACKHPSSPPRPVWPKTARQASRRLKVGSVIAAAV